MKDFFTNIYSKIKPIHLYYALGIIFAVGVGIFFAYRLSTKRIEPTKTELLPDTTIVKATGDFAYQNVTNNFETHFKESPTTPESIFFKNTLGDISFFTPSKQSFGEIISTTPPIADGGTITYPDIFSQIDLKYTLTSSKLLEEFIVKDAETASRITRIEQLAKTESIYRENADGSITFSNNGKVVFSLPHPVMYETGDSRILSNGISYEVRSEINQLRISKVITAEGKAWLSDPQRKYPIAIDLVIDNAEDLSTIDISVDDGDSSANWTGSDSTYTPVTQETTIKQQGTGSIKVGTTAENNAVDLFEFATNHEARYAPNSTSDAFSATGGTITTSGGYTIHTFTSSGTFAVSSGSRNVEVLVVAGGGGGGSQMGGGGGGGGVVYNPTYSVSPGNVTVTVGNGGTGAPAGISQVRGNNGENSVFGILTAIGGGGGGSDYTSNNSPPGSGGSGGGTAAVAGKTRALGTVGQGNDGGLSTATYYPGGGGGAGAAGGTAPGDGGIGIQSLINGTLLYYGAGGGGAGYTARAGNGGLGGGGGGAPKVSGGGLGGGTALNTGSDAEVGTLVAQTNKKGGNGGANTGGGGGGGSHYNLTNNGGNGGSGVVILKYLTPSKVSDGPVVATGGTITNVDGYNIHTFTTSGTFTVTSGTGNVEVLAVGGGGGGGSDMGGGGGGGGVVYKPSYGVSPSGISVTIGSGGTGAPAGISQVRGTNGQDTVFGTITAFGGGGGGSEYSNNGSPASIGGSGGGTSAGAGKTPGAGSGQGYPGATGTGSWYGGGGGGAGGPGFANPANGGTGLPFSISGTLLYYGGGGGGSGYSEISGNGGIGGGGGGSPKVSGGGLGGGRALNVGSDAEVGVLAAQTNKKGGNGGANTGGGGGGGSHYNLTNNGGNGGSGVVLVRYPSATYPTTGYASNDPGINATGGIITYSGGYKIHMFKTSETFNILSGSGTVETLVVAGGGGGGNVMGGGGGGGGVVSNSSYAVIPGKFAVTVGAGGAGAPAGIISGGTNGRDSSFGTITAIGGGGGGTDYNSTIYPAKSGGSGGGAPSSVNTVAGSGTANQGNAGGGGGVAYYPGGGGGAGGAGGVNPGEGGVGIQSSITGTSLYYGGGGAGAGYSLRAGNGGQGGGGGGAPLVSGGGYGSTTGALSRGSDALAGTLLAATNKAGGNGGANTGGGGGGGSHHNATNKGGDGGSGVVIIRYPIPPLEAFSSAGFTATGGTISTSGTNTIHTFTSNGTLAVASGSQDANTLVVAGGGGGGNVMGGGGGGGGVVSSTYRLTPGTASISVGAGGGGAPAGIISSGSNGTDSYIDTLTAFGGGGGGTNYGTNTMIAGNGGSGGGTASNLNLYAGLGYGGQGNRGGEGGTTYYPAGGGGAGAVGGVAPGDGGAGVLNAINGTGLYWGGGGGGAGYSERAGNGGVGGGGGGAPKVSGGGLGGGSAINTGSDGAVGALLGSANVPGGNGGANTGGGGGGGSHYNLTNKGGDGGSGIVILSYPTANTSAINSEGLYGLKVVAQATTSLNKTLTKTFPTTVNLSTYTTVTFALRSNRTGSNIKVGLHDTGGTTTEVTPNITSADVFQTFTINLSGVSGSNRDTIDKIIITIVNADADNTFYIDDLKPTLLSIGDTITKTVSPQDLSGVTNITFWVRSSIAGTFATFGFGETNASEQTTPITINQANTWEQKSWDVSGISASAKDAVTKYAFTVASNTSGANLYFDDIRTFNTTNTWTSSDPTFTTVSQETTLKAAGAGSVKVQTTADVTNSDTLDLMEYSSDANAQAAYVIDNPYTLTATGGTITTPGSNKIHTFTTSGTFDVTLGSSNVDYLIVGGGGGYGGGVTSVAYPAGGGGGQVLSGVSSIGVAAYPVTVGTGGAGTVATSTNGTDGVASVFNGITAASGKGGKVTGVGGASGSGRTGGAKSTTAAGGGGGNAVNGSAAPNATTGGAGGAGTASSISGASVYYGGGGGGGSSTTYGAHGLGTIGGGGGYSTGANGADGTVIISYPINLSALSESTIKTEGSYSLKVTAAITSTLNKTITRTIGSPINLSNRSNVTFDIRSSRTGSNIKVGIHDTGGSTTEVTPNITGADVFQTATIDLSAVTNANKDAIDKIIITIVNADAANTFYIDNMRTPLFSIGDTITRTGSTTDLSDIANLTFWVRSSIAGTFATFGFGETNATEQTTPITINQADTWESKSWDISGISASAKNDVRKFAFAITSNTGGAAFYFDDIQSNQIYRPTLGSSTILSDTSIRWNFTDNSTDETGHKVYDTLGNEMKTCAGSNLSFCDETGLTPNTSYDRKIGAYNSLSDAITTGTITGLTLAAVPPAPTVTNRTTTTADVNVSPGTNPIGTLFALYQESGTVCDGTGGFYLDHLNQDGINNGSTPVWMTDADWGTITVPDLTSESTFSFCTKAKNSNNVETAFGSSGSGDTGFIPVSGDFVSTEDTASAVNKYFKKDDATRYIIGLDKGTGTQNDAILELRSGIFTVNSNETLVTGSMILTGGSMAIVDGGDIKLGVPVWVLDNDTDGIAPDTDLAYGDRPSDAWKRKASMTSLSSLDCDDANAAVIKPSATGGTITTITGYIVHTFTGSGTFTMTCIGQADPITVDYLIVAGGGASGAGTKDTYGGGGGGAGGLRTGTTTIASGAYTITVAAGGAVGAARANNSSALGITASGGGTEGTSGGSGGGGGSTGNDPGGAGSAGQGNAGGNGVVGSAGHGGGCGSTGAAGGSGCASSIKGSSSVYSTGGRKGGASGVDGATGGSVGTPNTGMGGNAGNAGNLSNAPARAGGSGIVIIRYAN